MKFNSSFTVAVASAILGLTTFDFMPAQAATLTQNYRRGSDLRFNKFDSQIGTLNHVTFKYKFEVASVWNLIDQDFAPCGASYTIQETGKYAECEVKWDIYLHGSNGLEEVRDEKSGLVEIFSNGQELNFGIEGSVALSNISFFVGNNNEMVGEFTGEGLVQYYEKMTPLVSFKNVTSDIRLTYDYTPQPVPEPTTSVGIAMSFLGIGMLRKKRV